MDIKNNSHALSRSIGLPRLAVISLLLCASSAAKADNFEAIFTPMGPGQNSPDVATWKKTPSVSDIVRAFPKGAVYRGITQWKCGVKADGHLTNCQLQTSLPHDEPKYGRAGKSLLPYFQLDSRSLELAVAKDKKVLFEIPITNSEAKIIEVKDCTPPFCVPVLPPPKL